jgi:tetratricopeptide (TPR) repeat protein
MESKTVSFYENEDFRLAMHDCQVGNWLEGIEKLRGLEQRYPLEQELKSIRQGMEIRARVDNYEATDKKRDRFSILLSWVSRLVVLLLAAVFVYFGVQTYASNIQEQFNSTRQQVESQVSTLEMVTKFRNAQNLLQADRPIEARVLFEEIYAVDPHYPQLDIFMAEAETLAVREENYNAAIQLYDSGDLTGSLTAFQSIEAEDKYYKDVGLRIQQIQKEMGLEEQFVEAIDAFSAKRWVEAIAQFQALADADPTYKQQDVEQFLYDSYLKAAEEQLSSPTPSLDSLQAAEDYFQKALALRPQNEEVLAKRTAARSSIEAFLVNSYIQAARSALTQKADSLDALRTAEEYFSKALLVRPGDATITQELYLARTYLDAVDNFNRGLWDRVIDNLETVYAVDNDYAEGTARQTLYDAYVARGKSLFASGNFLLALSDYERAAVIAQESPDSLLRLFEAQTLVAYTQGVLRNYQQAVLIYQEALVNSGLDELARSKNVLFQDLTRARALSDEGNWESSYYLYRDTLSKADELYERTTYVVKGGDYITMLARKYNSTVGAVLAANGLTNLSQVLENQVIIIPNLP